MRLFATTARGCESVLAEELVAIGAARVSSRPSGVAFEGDLEVAYRACLWSRVASRVLLALDGVDAGDPDALYAGARAVPWEEHASPDHSIAVDVTRSEGASIDHTKFAAQRVKDAIVDRFRARVGRRPSVDLDAPDLRIAVHLGGDRATLSLDLSGSSLHRRGYRGLGGGVAPLKENLAAAVLLRAGWGRESEGGPTLPTLLDPMCGSGTFLIEAAHIAAGSAPGLAHRRFGFHRWLGHRPAIWDRVVAQALAVEESRAHDPSTPRPRLIGYDADAGAIALARAVVAREGLEDWIELEVRDLASLLREPAPSPTGLLVTNPPWGERMGDIDSVAPLYATLGELLRGPYAGYRAAVLTGNARLGLRMGVEARKRHTMHNGPIECQLLLIDAEAARADKRARRGERGPAERSAPSPGAEALTNRLRKRLERLRKWAEREGTDCYRLYDADLPEYAIAVDLYASWVHVQEYAAPAEVEPELAARRLKEALRVVSSVLEVPRERIVLKIRERQRGKRQYEKLDTRGHEIVVHERPARFLVNLHDHLDTGLFLDHRSTRARIRELAAGGRFLNLYAYTGTATVQAALGGARSTTSVDLSATYLDWARRNLALNGFEGPEHRGVQADCRAWLRDDRGFYELIFLDPPTFSNSKRLDETLDIQRDHVELVRASVARLAPAGLLLFSTNSRRFRLDEEALAGLRIADITRKTIPVDFERSPRIHQTFEIRAE